MKKIKISIKAFNINALINIKNKINKKGYILNMPFKGVLLPSKKKLFTTLKSPHVNKTAREQFLFITYKYLIILKFNTTLTIIDQIKLKIFLNLLKNLSGNVQIKIQYIT